MSRYNGGFVAALPAILDLHDRGLSPKQIEAAVADAGFRDRYGSRPSQGMIKYILQREGRINDNRSPLTLPMTTARQDLLALPKDEVLDRSVDEFEFSARVANCLNNEDI